MQSGDSIINNESVIHKSPDNFGGFFLSILKEYYRLIDFIFLQKVKNPIFATLLLIHSSLVVVFHCDAGVIEKQDPDVYRDSVWKYIPP